MKRFLLVSSYPACNELQVVASDASHSFFPSFRFFPLKALLVIGALIYGSMLGAQEVDQQAEYRKVIKERSAKIVNTLGITDSARYQRVLDIIANQYFQLNTIHEATKASIADIRKQSQSKESTEEAVKKAELERSGRLTQLHGEFIAHLNSELTEEQVEKVKDGMTYRVFPITWTAYQDMLPRLTSEQKTQIYNWLKEARELAMDAESSEKKHQVFGKFKGKINNYLSAAGYDMKKEGEEWQKRIKEREAGKKNQEG